MNRQNTDDGVDMDTVAHWIAERDTYETIASGLSEMIDNIDDNMSPDTSLLYSLQDALDEAMREVTVLDYWIEMYTEISYD